MNEQTFADWLDRYGHAWERRDPAAAADLFTEDALYYETPFDEPFAGRAAIRDYWTDVPRLQTGISFSYEILSVQEKVGIARWWAEFQRIGSGHRVRLDGIMVVTMAENGRCRLFQEWWHKEEADDSKKIN